MIQRCLKSFLTGFDLVGSENDLKTLLHYIEPLLRCKRRVEELGLDLPFIFHAGETFGDGSESDNNLYDAILLGTKRIGHGYVQLGQSVSKTDLAACRFSLVKHPKLLEMCKERGIAIEVCPIS